MNQNECNTTQQTYRGRRACAMTKNNVMMQGRVNRTVCKTVCTTTEEDDRTPVCEMQHNQSLPSTGEVCHKNCRQLKCMIDQISFAMDDTRLFLDTHPDCKEALDYYKKMKKMRKEAIDEYKKHCGAMLAYEAEEDDCGTWNWVNGPLPWENMNCNGRRM